ncbi:hypothetical protein ACTHHL_04390 [Aeribacillus composti]|uniref:hypothetical protein n=1 Tax=Aeribacillus composti TaxID=1868734 RepID=UPI00406A5FC2
MIGSWAISNTLAVTLINIDYGIEDVATVKLPDGTTETAIIRYDEDDSYIELSSLKLYFSDCMRA